MTLLERLQSHKGGLIRLKTQFFWYGRGWDGNPGRICLLLDAAAWGTISAAAGAGLGAVAAADAATAVALLLIDDRPQWIWLAEDDVEVIDESV